MMSIICRIGRPTIIFYLAPCRQIGDMYRRQAIATNECHISYAGDRVRNGHTRQGRATFECSISYAGDGVRDSHTRQARAIPECIPSYAGHGVFLVVIFYFFRDDYRAGVFIRI